MGGPWRLIARPLLIALGLGASAPEALGQPRPETILQYFETSWAEITRRIPEVAAAGYTAIWLPPPTKGAEGSADVGFSVFDRFDLGEIDQRGSIGTKYGTRAEVVGLVREAHRFGLKVYFDTVMNHNANPGKIENPSVTLPPVRIEEFPGTHPLDYHLLPARDAGGGRWEVRNPALFGGGTYLLAPNVRENEPFVPVTAMPSGTSIAGFTHLARAPWIDFSNAGPLEEQYLSLLGLIDFAIEQRIQGGGPAADDGMNLVTEVPLPKLIRLPGRPDTYPNDTPIAEDIREYLVRWIRWFGDVTDCDGLRLDAIKHVPTEFFASDFAGDPIAFNTAFQDNLDRRRGSTDADDDDGLDDALLFGESFTGDFGSLGSYRQTGMFLLDFPLLFRLAHSGGVFARYGEGDIGQLSFPQGGMAGAFNEFGGLGRNAGVSFVQSHDTDAPSAQPDGAYAFITTRVGHSVVFYDGNNYNPNTFVRPGRVDALGELGSRTILDLVSIRRRFARGGMFNRYVDNDVYVYERVVPTEDGRFGATLLVAITDNTSAGARFGEFDPRPLLVAEFPPGTVLRELTGHGAIPEVTVVDPAAVPQSARDFALAEFDRSSELPLPDAYGFVYLEVPAGPSAGYVAYAPKTPPLAVALTTSGLPLADRTIETAGGRRTPSGAPIPAASISAGVLATGSPLTLTVSTDATASNVFFRIDGGGASVSGISPVSGSAEGTYDGFFEMRPDERRGGAVFRAEALDLSSLVEGVHLLTVRAAIAGAPTFYSEASVFFVIERASVEDAGLPVGGGDAATSGLDAAALDSGVEVDPDPDRDGIETERDVCPRVSDPEQSDFDRDGVGDACDVCPETDAGVPVDGSGCIDVGPELGGELDSIVRAILEERRDLTLDFDGDGRVDARDFVRRARRGVRR